MNSKNSKKTTSRKILLIITGSVAAYKSLDLIRLLQKKSYQVTVVMTKAATKFITPLLVSAISQNKVYDDLFSTIDEIEMGHIKLSRQNDLILVAPCSADFIAKIAAGYADDLASTIISATNKKVLIAPAMNEKMFNSTNNQKNLTKLSEIGIKIIEPETDILACGEYGIGKMSATENIFKAIEEYFDYQNLLKGKKILITGGPTYEPIDPVRFIGNYSSGIQAVEIARVMNEMGAEVTLIAANIKFGGEGLMMPIKKEKIIAVKTANQMFKQCQELIGKTDIFVASAAVADYKAENISTDKIKKNNSSNLSLKLVENIDILKQIGNCKNRPKIVVGFAAESKNLIKYAKEKLQSKNCDLIIANDIKSGAIFGNQQTDAYLIDKTLKVKKLGKISKAKLAEILAIKLSKYKS
jgi:phosphopantothenoylcysteine decarboxylase/phosphopantothenate--cysteine ligase